jgi:hypothetical protein
VGRISALAKSFGEKKKETLHNLNNSSIGLVIALHVAD